MFLYLVMDGSGWMSDVVSKSIDEAIISQSWRVKDPRFIVRDDFPLTILKIDTKLCFMEVKKVVQLAEMIARFQKNDSEKKGGSK